MASWIHGVGWIIGLLLLLGSSLFEISRRRTFVNPDPISADPMVGWQFRTAYHFQPLRKWMNDPNGPMYYNGYYHFFYQHNPKEARWVPLQHWGHSVSTDLVNWEKLPFALSGSEWYDINGCWSGSITMLPDNSSTNGKKPVVVYTGIDNRNRDVQAVAYPKNTSDPRLVEWVKPDYNPIIEPFAGVDPTLFRDPSTAWLGRDGMWRLVFGTVVGGDGQAVMYKSKDFVKWEKAEKPLFYNVGSGMWECLDFFPISVPGTGQKKYVLKVSMFDPLMYDQYTVGTYDEERDVFVGDDASCNDWRMWPRLDYGHIYAGKTFFDDAKGRRVLWGWLNESDTVDKGWAGIQIVPRVLTLDGEGKRLIQWPVEEIKSLRGASPIHMENIELNPGDRVEIEGLDALQADVEVGFELPSESLNKAAAFQQNFVLDPMKVCREKGPNDGEDGLGSFGLLVLASDDLEEHTTIHFRVFVDGGKYLALMCVDSRSSCKSKNVYKPASGGFVDVDIAQDGKKSLNLRTLIDRSVVESFGGRGRMVITSRVYPTALLAGRSLHLYAFNNGNETVKISELNAWNMTRAQIS